MALLDNAFYISGNTTIGGPIDIGSSNNAAGATLTLTGVTVPANSLVCVAVSEAVAVTAGTLSDGTNSYTAITSELMSTSVGIGVIFEFFYTGAQSNLTLTYTKGGTGDKCSMAAFYALGVNGTTPVDSAVTAVAQSTSATPTITSGVPTQSGDLIVAMVAYDYSSGEALTNAAPFAIPFDNVIAQTAAQLGGGNLNVAGSLAVTYAPTIAHAPTGAALIIVGFAPAATYTGWWAVTPWTAGAGATAGSLIRQNAMVAVGNERVFVCYNSTSGTGTTGATEPTWVITRGGQVTDNSVKWQECTGVAALNGDVTNTPTWTQYRTATGTATLGQVIQNGAGTLLLLCTTGGAMASLGSEPSWSAYTTTGATTADGAAAVWVTLGAYNKYSIWNSPHARTSNCLTTTWAQAGNAGFTSAVHAETQPSAMTIAGAGTLAAPIDLYCVANAPGSVPPGPTDITTGASISTTGNNSITVSGDIYANGLSLSGGTGANGTQVYFSAPFCSLENCALVKAGTTANGAAFQFGGAALKLTNTTLQFGSTGDSLTIQSSVVKWTRTNSAIAGSIVPTKLFSFFSGVALVELQGIDLSALGSGKTIFGAAGGYSGYWQAQDCKFGLGVTISTTPGQQGFIVDIITSDSAATNYQQQRYALEGTITPSNTVYRSGGATDLTTPISRQLVTTANAKWIDPLEDFVIAEWNTLTGSTRTITMYGIVNGAAVPNNDQIWLECEYFGSASSPLGSFANNTKANNLAAGTPLTADSTSNWGAGLTARQNSHAYSVGAIIGLASNPNRVFFCTASTGSSAASEPAGYASCVDGGSVTDGSCTFRAGCRFSMVVTLTAQMVGYIYGTVKAAQPSTTFYVDPLMNFS